MFPCSMWYRLYLPLNIFGGGKLANRVTACQACDDLHLPAEAQEEMKDKGQ